MENEPKHITEAQWAKYFAGECSDEESRQIEEWISESQENQDLYLEYAVMWEDLGSFENSVSASPVDVDQAWQKVVEKKSMEDSIPQVSFPWLKIAASLVFVVGLFFAISQLNETKLLLTETKQETKNVNLADGSQIILNENSSLRYPEQFDGERKVTLTGEAFFDIAHDEQKQFIIQIGEATVTVLGTAFNIKSSGAADTVSVFVLRGKVSFAFQDQSLILGAGQKATLFAAPSILKMESRDPAGLDDFWRTRKLTFTGQNLSYVASSLSKAYDRKIVLKENKLENCGLSATFENDSLSNVLDVISLTLDLKVDKNGDTIILSGEGCAPN